MDATTNVNPEAVPTVEILHGPDFTRVLKADKIVKNHVYYTMGVGLVPVPIVDIVGISALQARMVKELAELYAVPYRHDMIKSILAGLLSSLAAMNLAVGTFSLLRSVPLLGPLIAFAGTALYTGGATYAVGRVFIQHFELGGTLLDFNAQEVKQYFEQEYNHGKKFVKDIRFA